MIITIPYKPRRQAIQVHECSAKYITLIAHRRFGKSHILFNEGQKRALSKKGRYGIVTPYSTQGRSIYEKGGIINKYRPHKYSNFNKNEMMITYANGSIFEIIGSENYDAYRGTQYDWIGFDETDDHRPEAWEQVFKYSVMAQKDGSFSGGSVMFAGTLKGEGFLWKNYMMDSPNRKSFLFKASETGILSEEDIEEIKKECGDNDAVMLQELECVPMHYTGLVMREFRRDVNVIPPFDIEDVEHWEWHRFEAIDVGSVHPTAILHAVEDKEGTIYIVSEHEEQYMDAQKIASVVKSKRFSRNGVYKKPMYTVIDTSAGRIDQTSGTSIREQLSELGVHTDGANKDVQGSVMKLNSMFKYRKLYIFSTCTKLIEQMMNVRWAASKDGNMKETIVKRGDDLFDALRYLVMSRPDLYTYKEVKVHPTKEQILRNEMKRINYTQERKEEITDQFYLS